MNRTLIQIEQFFDKNISKKVNFFLAILSVGYIFLAQSLLAGWQVDDAAISFSYANNLSSTGQLIAQTNQMPVEGFSNPLWVFILAIIFRLGFDYHIVPYICSFLLCITALRIIFFQSISPETKIAFGVAGLMLVIQPSILIWAFSGLENAVFLYVGTELLLRCFDLAFGRITTSGSVVAGFFASAIILSRPDGIVYLALFPMVAIFSNKVKYHQLILATTLPIITLVLYECFRLYYFNDWLPNTYYAKGGVTGSRIFEIILMGPVVFKKLGSLLGSLFGFSAAFWGGIATAQLVESSWSRGYKTVLIPPLTMLFLAVLVYLLLPEDWMGEQRFATLFYPASCLVISIALITSIFHATFRVVLIAVFLLFSTWYSVTRMQHFIDNPAISIDEVEEHSRKFESWALKLGMSRASLMTADVGGLLLRNKLDVVDSGMLCDKTIAEAIGESNKKNDMQRFYNYVFDVKKPTFISTRAYHSWLQHLDNDPRFRRDYIALREYKDNWILHRYGEEMYSGDYVRKDQLQSSEILMTLQDEASKLYYPFCKECPAYNKSNEIKVFRI
jgi:hypothetical protein